MGDVLYPNKQKNLDESVKVSSLKWCCRDKYSCNAYV